MKEATSPATAQQTPARGPIPLDPQELALVSGAGPKGGWEIIGGPKGGWY